MSRSLSLPPQVAKAAYDQRAAAAQVWSVDTDGSRLRVAQAIPPASSTRYAPLRASRALVLAGLHRYPVELELLPWSASRTELGMRPVGTGFRRFPPGPVVKAGHALLRRFDELLCWWAEQPLRELSAELGRSEGRLGTTSW
jgi:hypothetical protein